MNAKDAIHQTLAASDMILSRYLDDLSDSDLRVRAVEGMNPIAWQVGHLITSERRMVEEVRPNSCPALPEGFEAAHPREESERSADGKGYRTKDEYLALWKAQREATLKVLDALTDEELDAPGPERFQRMAKTVGSVFNLAGTHALMHVGQFVAVRRKVGKPIAI